MVTDKEHDEILKQRLPPKLRAYLDKFKQRSRDAPSNPETGNTTPLF